MKIDVELTEAQQRSLATIPKTAWFTQISYRNVESPQHPVRFLSDNARMKQALVQDWIVESVRDKTVLDLFCANGAFSVMAAMAGAREVVGLDFSDERIECAKFLASTLPVHTKMEFIRGNVYKLQDYFSEPFDVVICLGGLYHIADPGIVLRLIGSLTRERLILQTSQVLPVPGNWARFVVRRFDGESDGMTSIRSGHGSWYCSPACLRELIGHGGFSILQERRPRLVLRRRFPWYLALCAPVSARGGPAVGSK